MRFHHGHQAAFEEAGMMLARCALQTTSKSNSASLYDWHEEQIGTECQAHYSKNV